MTLDFTQVLIFMAGAGCAMLPAAYQNLFRTPRRLTKRKVTLRKKRQWEGIKQHTRRAEICSAILDAASFLGANGQRVSRYASFRTVNGLPVQPDSPAIGLMSLDGALHHAVYPEGALPDNASCMERTAAKELLHFLHATVFCLMPYEYRDIFEFSNLAPFREIRAVLSRAITELKPPCPSADAEPLASDHLPNL